MSEPDEELDWKDKLVQEIDRVEIEMKKDNRRESARETTRDRQETREDGEVIDETGLERAARRARSCDLLCSAHVRSSSR